MNIEYILSSSNEESSFVGLRVNKEKVEIHFPEFLDFSHGDEERKIKDIRSLLDVIYFSKVIENQEVSKSDLEDVHIRKNLFYSYLWIIEHYLSGSSVNDWHSIKRQNYKGKIDWKSTMFSYPNIIDDYLFYDKIVSSRLEMSENSIEEVYKYCVSKAIENLGWIYGLEVMEYNRRPINVSNYIIFVQKQLRHTHNEKKKELYTNILSILLDVINEKDDSITTFGTYNFSLIYESLVFSVFNNVKNISDFYPISYWEIDSFRYNNSKLRPDAILVKNESVCIIDAKYYRYEITKKINDLPRTDSIQKQLTYQDHIKHTQKLNVKHNLFLVPNTTDEEITIIGKATASWRSLDNSILLISIGLRALINLSLSSMKAKEFAQEALLKKMSEFQA